MPIQQKPWCFLNTLGKIVSSPSYVSHEDNTDYTDLLEEDPEEFAGVMWFHALDQVSAVHSDPSIRALDDLKAAIGSRADSVIASCANVSAAIRQWLGKPLLWYLGRIDADVDLDYWREHLRNGTMETEVDRLLAYIPADDMIAVDSIGILRADSEFAPILHYLCRMFPGRVWSEGAARPGFLPWTLGCPNLTILNSARHTPPEEWPKYRTPRIVWRTQNYSDDFDNPVAPEDWQPGVDYASTQIPFAQRGDYIMIVYNGAEEWEVAREQFQDLLDNAGVLVLTDAAGVELGIDGDTATLPAMPLGSTVDVTFKVKNLHTGTITLDTNNPSISGDGSLSPDSFGDGSDTPLAAGASFTFIIRMNVLSPGDKTIGISLPIVDGDAFTFTLKYRVAAPGGGKAGAAAAIAARRGSVRGRRR